MDSDNKLPPPPLHEYMQPATKPTASVVIIEPTTTEDTFSHIKATEFSARHAIDKAAARWASTQKPTVTAIDSHPGEPDDLKANPVHLQAMKQADVVSVSVHWTKNNPLGLSAGREFLDNLNTVFFVAEGNEAKHQSFSTHPQQEDPHNELIYNANRVGVGQAGYDKRGNVVIKDFSTRSSPSFVSFSPYEKNTEGLTLKVHGDLDEMVRVWEQKYPNNPKTILYVHASVESEKQAEEAKLQGKEIDQEALRHRLVIENHKKYDKDPAYMQQVNKESQIEWEKNRDEYRKMIEERLEDDKAYTKVNKDGEATLINGSSFAAPTAAGYAGQIAQDHDIRGKELIALMCMSTTPVERVEGQRKPIDHVDTAIGKPFDPTYSGWGVLEPDKLQANAKRLVELRQGDDVPDGPQLFSISQNTPKISAGDASKPRVLTFAVDQDGRLINSQFTLELEGNNPPSTLRIVSPSGVIMDVPGAIVTPNHNPEYTNSRIIVNTDGFMGDSTKGEWKIELPQEHTVKDATIQLNATQKGSALDRLMDEVAVQHGKHAEITPPAPETAVAARTNEQANPGFDKMLSDFTPPPVEVASGPSLPSGSMEIPAPTSVTVADTQPSIQVG